MMKTIVFTTAGLLIAAAATFAADRHRPVIVTASNDVNNQLLVFDTAGALIESVPTLGQFLSRARPSAPPRVSPDKT